MVLKRRCARVGSRSTKSVQNDWWDASSARFDAYRVPGKRAGDGRAQRHALLAMSEDTPDSLIPYDDIVQEALRAGMGQGIVRAQIINGAPLSYNWQHAQSAEGINARQRLTAPVDAVIVTEAIPLAKCEPVDRQLVPPKPDRPSATE